MTEKEWKRISAAYAAAKSLRDQEDQLCRLIRALSRRRVNGNLDLTVRHEGAHYRYTWYGKIPAHLVSDAILPALHEVLKNLRSDWKAFRADQ